MKSTFLHAIIRPASLLAAFALVVSSFGFAVGATPTAFAVASPSTATSTPDVTTLPATSVTASDATLNALNGASDANAYLFWVATSTFSTASPTMPAGVYSTPDFGTVAAGMPFSAQLSSATGLPTVMPNTTYYYTAWVHTDAGWSPGSILSFTTASAPMTGSVTTLPATSVTSSDATLNALNGAADATGHSFWVSTSTFSTASPTIPSGVYSTPDLGAINATTPFSAQLSSVTGLPTVTPDTTYYYAGWANVGGTWTPGSILQFTTASSTGTGTGSTTMPTVTSISPASGTTSGGTSVTITGTGFTGATAVHFGTTTATITATTSDTSLTVTAPAATTAGAVDVTVTTPTGTSATSSGDRYTYQLGGTVGGGTQPGGTLTVNSITPIKTTATADNTYENGWSYMFDITVPTSEPNLSMMFSNWMDTASDTLPVADNMRISSAQASNTDPVTITAANMYSSPALHIVGTTSTTTPGYHVQVLVEVKVPLNTVNGTYTTNYAVQTQP